MEIPIIAVDCHNYVVIKPNLIILYSIVIIQNTRLKIRAFDRDCTKDTALKLFIESNAEIFGRVSFDKIEGHFFLYAWYVLECRT
jgi:hypothetical protein